MVYMVTMIKLIQIFILLFYVNLSLPQDNKVVKNINSVNPENLCFSIKNNSKDISYTSIKLNDKIFCSVEEMKKEINNRCGSNKDSLFYYAWEFVCNNTFYSTPVTNRDWSLTTILYLNSLGFGLCARQAVLLAKLWKELGYQVRVVDLRGHVVPEVLINKRWSMMDPSYMVFYFNRKNKIASVKQLRKNPRLITNPEKKITRGFLSHLRYSKDIARIYKLSESDNFLYQDLPPDIISDFFIAIPPNSIFEFPGIFEANKNKSDKTRLQYFANGRLKIPPRWTGCLYNRLVISGINGTGQVVINKTSYNINDTALLNLLQRKEDFITELTIKEHPDTIEIIYYINPVLVQPKHENEIIVSGNNHSFLQIDSFHIPDSLSVTKRLLEEYFFYDQKRIDLLMAHDPGLSYCSKKQFKIKNKSELFETIKQYFTCSENGDLSAVEKQMNKFTSAFNRIPANFNFNIIYNTVNLLHGNLIFQDIKNANEEMIYIALYNLSKVEN